VWEPSANAHSLPNALSHGSLIAGAMPVPEMVITIGTVGLSRSVLGLLKATNRHISVHLSCNGPDRPDPVRSADEILEHIPNATTTVEPAWLEMWRAADATASQIVTEGLRGQSLTGASAAVELWHHLADEATLLVGASWPVRHIEAFAPVRSGVRVFGNRGANGIDGLLSTAYGLALCASHRTYALVGDVSFLYGAHGLLHGTERAANLTVVVLDNDGGGIFSQLEQSAPEFDSYFERVFGTPHGRDLWVVAESLGAPAVRVTTREELVTALRRTDSLPGLHVIVVTTSARNSEATLLRDLAARVAQAVT
jgi:2-succinyl-5-enolpyruvyl-6-hydroxy-3-cyclohexene-1-carboxylate synthase